MKELIISFSKKCNPSEKLKMDLKVYLKRVK